ncbi:MAG: AarF/ABC1/UbiB kinase family protein [Dermabacter sp.]|nr:AarF/ABC1/UbiB kinase family protein [Dermabacter sp.]
MDHHTARMRQIAQILTKHGWELVAGAAALDPRFQRLTGADARSESESVSRTIASSPEVVRETLEDLGPTAVKLGQALSTRPDLISDDLIAELEKLQSDARPIEWEDVQRTIETELGTPMGDVFAHVEKEPLGTASLGQAHAARLIDGTEVVIKVQRPGIAPTVDADLSILADAARRIEGAWPEARELGLAEVVADFDRQLRAELDYTKEAGNADRIAHNLAHRSYVHVPRIWHDLTTERMVTMERMYGLNISDAEALDAVGIDRPQLAKNAATVILDMLLDDGFYHADPHPGNLKVEDDGTIGLLDFGMVGSLSERQRGQLISLILAFMSGSAQSMTSAVLTIAPASGHIDMHALESDIAHMLSLYSNRPLGEVSSSDVVSDLLDVCRRHHLRPAPFITSIARLLTIIEGIGRALDSDFDVNAILRSYVIDLAKRRLTPERISRTLVTDAVETARSLAAFGPMLNRFLTKLDQDGVPLDIDPRRLEPSLQRFSAIGDRITVALIVAALITAVGNLGATDTRWLARLRGPLLTLGTAGLAASGTYLLASRRRGVRS